jgi:hypothetical protein
MAFSNEVAKRDVKKCKGRQEDDQDNKWKEVSPWGLLRSLGNPSLECLCGRKSGETPINGVHRIASQGRVIPFAAAAQKLKGSGKMREHGVVARGGSH